jgi:hypothetical protein
MSRVQLFAYRSDDPKTAELLEAAGRALDWGAPIELDADGRVTVFRLGMEFDEAELRECCPQTLERSIAYAVQCDQFQLPRLLDARDVSAPESVPRAWREPRFLKRGARGAAAPHLSLSGPGACSP